MKASEWDWNNDGIMPSDNDWVSRKVNIRDIAQIPNGVYHYSGGRFALVRRNIAGLPRPQDPYRKVVLDENNVVTHDFGTVPQGYSQHYRGCKNVIVCYCITRANPRFLEPEQIDAFLNANQIEDCHDNLRYCSPFDPRLKRLYVIRDGEWFAEGVAYIGEGIDVEEIADEIQTFLMTSNPIPDVKVLLK